MSAKLKTLVAAGMLLVAAGSCNVSDLQDDAAPVTLVLSTTQNITRFDLAGNAPTNTNCNEAVALVQFEVITKNPTPGTIGVPPGTAVDPRFNTVQLRSYRVSYVRTDGGRQVPAPFVRSLSAQILPGGSTGIDTLILVQADALNQAPFAALRPNNGGRDPETGRPVVQMDIIIEAFGETLAGENVSGVTRVPVDFCFNCGGCD